MMHLKTYESFSNQEDIIKKGVNENKSFNVGKVLPDYDEVISTVNDLTLDLQDDGFGVELRYKNYPDVGLSKQKSGWKAVPGTYLSVSFSMGEYSMENPNPFKFSKKIYETYLDIHSYVEDHFGVTEDGYNIEYYFETLPIKEDIPHYWNYKPSDYVWKKGNVIEDSFYSIDEFNDFSEKHDLEFAYVSISYKVE